MRKISDRILGIILVLGGLLSLKLYLPLSGVTRILTFTHHTQSFQGTTYGAVAGTLLPILGMLSLVILGILFLATAIDTRPHHLTMRILGWIQGILILSTPLLIFGPCIAAPTAELCGLFSGVVSVGLIAPLATLILIIELILIIPRVPYKFTAIMTLLVAFGLATFSVKAVAPKTGNDCASIGDTGTRNHCYTQFTRFEKNGTYCERIEAIPPPRGFEASPILQDTCFLIAATETKDASFCEKISLPEKREVCVERVAEN